LNSDNIFLFSAFEVDARLHVSDVYRICDTIQALLLWLVKEQKVVAACGSCLCQWLQARIGKYRPLSCIAGRRTVLELMEVNKQRFNNNSGLIKKRLKQLYCIHRREMKLSVLEKEKKQVSPKTSRFATRHKRTMTCKFSQFVVLLESGH